MFRLSPVNYLVRLLLIGLIAGSCFPVLAQQFTGTLRGTVQDSAGAVIAGAEVTITHISTNVARNVVTEENGTYVVPQLQPGLYRVTVKKNGFKAGTVDDVKLDVQQIREVDIRLEVGAATESVTVSASG